jgi:hypothetical protein
MSILKTWHKMPEAINYEGYTFRLIVRGDFVGYFLTGCFSKKKYKRAAFSEGYWLEKGRCPVSSVGSNYLFKVLLFDTSDRVFLQALKELQQFLIKNRLLMSQSEAVIEDTEFTEVKNWLSATL